MVFKHFCIIVLWMKVVLALERLLCNTPRSLHNSFPLLHKSFTNTKQPQNHCRTNDILLLDIHINFASCTTVLYVTATYEIFQDVLTLSKTPAVAGDFGLFKLSVAGALVITKPIFCTAIYSKYTRYQSQFFVFCRV